jgi:hypothetical protein
VLELLWGVGTYFDELNKILEITVQGNRMVQGFPRIVELIGVKEEQDNQGKDESRLSLTEIAARAEFAKNEAEKGHPTLFAHALVATWSVVETCIEDIGVGFLVNEPAFLNKEVFSKVKVPLAEFELLDKEERARFLLGEVERQRAARRYGVDRFEPLLEPFGLSGAVPDEIKKPIYACDHIRNVIVHRRSVVDRRLVESCPWLNAKIGDRIFVTARDFRMYHYYLWQYMEIVTRRLRDYFSKSAPFLRDSASTTAPLANSEEKVMLKTNGITEPLHEKAE